MNKLSNNLEKEESRLLIKEILYSNKEKIPLIFIYFSDKSRQLNSRAMKWIPAHVQNEKMIAKHWKAEFSSIARKHKWPLIILMNELILEINID